MSRLQISQIIERIKKGESIKDIAYDNNVSTSAIYTRLSRNGLRLGRHKMIDVAHHSEKVGIYQTSLDYGVTEKYVHTARYRLKKGLAKLSNNSKTVIE